MNNTYILLASCKDRVGITNLITGTISKYDSNILHLDHFTEYENENSEEGQLYLRFEFEKVDSLKGALEKELEQQNIYFELFDSSVNTKIALFVSKEDHAFNEVLLRVERGEIPAEIVCAVSNHEDNRHFAESLGVPFYHVPSNEPKDNVEEKMISICEEH